MQDENKDYILDESAFPFRPVAIPAGMSMAFLLVCALIENGLDVQILLAFAVGVPLVLGMLALLCRWMGKYRFRVDAQGLRIDEIFGKATEMRWKDIRTAAIVHYDGSKELVLSVHEPEKVLVKKQLMRGRYNKNEEMHFGASDRMRKLVEHYLHMTLPEIRL